MLHICVDYITHTGLLMFVISKLTKDVSLTPTFFSDFNADLKYRFCSIVHSFIVSLALSLWFVGYNIDIYDLYLFSFAFTMYDICNMCADTHRRNQAKPIAPPIKKHDNDIFIFHHIVMMIGITCMYNVTNPEILMIGNALFLSEWSTPFLNISILLHHCKLDNSLIYKFNNILVMITYTVFRIVLFAINAYKMYEHSMFYTMLTVIFFGLNLKWYRKLLQKCFKSHSV